MAEKNLTIVDDKALAIIKQFDAEQAHLEETKAKLDAVKSSIYKNMEANGVKSFETDEFKFTLVAPSDTTTMNIEKMKEEGVYEYYKDKPSHRNGYVKYTRKVKKK